MTLTETIAEQRRLLAAAAPRVAPWGTEEFEQWLSDWEAHIAAAHNALPVLLDALEAHEKALRALVEERRQQAENDADGYCSACCNDDVGSQGHTSDCPLIAAEAVLAGWEAKP